MSAPPCPRCGSNGLYRDDDDVAGVRVVACRMCGHRIYQGSDPALALTVLELPEVRRGPWRNRRIPVDPLGRESQFSENEEIDEQETEKEEDMGKTGPCANCGRVKQIVGNGCCWACYTYANGLAGEARVKALAECKAKIRSGEIQTRAPYQMPTPPEMAAATKSDAYPKPAEVHLAGESPRIVPVTLRLSIEITVRVNTVSA